MKQTRLIKTILIALLLLVPVSSQAKETWNSIRSKNFLVIGNAGEGEMRKVATRLEQFRQALVIIFPRLKLESAIPTTVIIFKNHDSFRPFKPRYKGKTMENVGGYFLSRQDMNYIVLTAETRGASPYEVIFHEYEHFITSNNMRKAPLWLNEGLAEFYSTFTPEQDPQKVRLGDPIPNHILALRNNRLLPLKTLLTVDRKSPHYNESSKAGIFYAESWALIHYLMIGNEGKRKEQLTRFINQLNSEIPLEENFRQSFQADYQTIEKELDQYVRKFIFPALIVTFKQQFDYAKEMQSVPLSEAETHYHLGDLLLQSGRYEESEEHLRKALKIDAGFAPAQTALGILRFRQKQFAEARSLLQAAIDSDPKSYLAPYYYAESLAQEGHNEEAIKFYRQSILLNPKIAQMHADLGYVYLALRRDEEANESFKEAIRLDPNNPYLYRTRSYIYLRSGYGGFAARDALTYLKWQGWRDDHAPYMALVAHFGFRQAQRASDADKILEDAVAKGDTSAWPSPVVRYLQRSLAEKELLAQANDNDKLTEAHTYVGLDLSLSGNKEAAIPHLRWVRENGNQNFVEYPLALAELSRIEKTP
ncbi:MAG TPA: tetratricopeptide repeat protein [Pyrinomonadaceae bacterium]|jgi:tetratricopeptide (TPR) repeat protein